MCVYSQMILRVSWLYEVPSRTWHNSSRTAPLTAAALRHAEPHNTSTLLDSDSESGSTWLLKPPCNGYLFHTELTDADRRISRIGSCREHIGVPVAGTLLLLLLGPHTTHHMHTPSLLMHPLHMHTDRLRCFPAVAPATPNVLAGHTKPAAANAAASALRCIHSCLLLQWQMIGCYCSLSVCSTLSVPLLCLFVFLQVSCWLEP